MIKVALNLLCLLCCFGGLCCFVALIVFASFYVVVCGVDCLDYSFMVLFVCWFKLLADLSCLWVCLSFDFVIVVLLCFLLFCVITLYCCYVGCFICFAGFLLLFVFCGLGFVIYFDLT